MSLGFSSYVHGCLLVKLRPSQRGGLVGSSSVRSVFPSNLSCSRQWLSDLYAIPDSDIYVRKRGGNCRSPARRVLSVPTPPSAVPAGTGSGTCRRRQP